MPARPGSRKASPSSVMPCTAIATRPTSAVHWCASSIARAWRGAVRPAIARPSATDAVMHSSATTPAAREASHQACSAGSGGVMPPPPRVRRPAPGRARRARPRRPHARARRRARARPASPVSTATLASVSASRAVGATAVAASTPAHAGAPVAGSSRWCAVPRPVPPGAADDARRRDRRVGEGEPRRGRAAQRVRDVDLVRAAEADVPAAVGDPRARGREQRRDPVGDMALARAAEVEPQARRPGDRAGGVVDRDRAPAPGRARGAAARPGPAGGGTGGRGRHEGARVAGRLERAEQARVDEAAAALRRPQRRADRVAERPRGRDHRARVGVERAELGAGAEARAGGLEALDQLARGRREQRRVGRGDQEADVGAHGPERLVDAEAEDHDAPVVTGRRRGSRSGRGRRRGGRGRRRGRSGGGGRRAGGRRGSRRGRRAAAGAGSSSITRRTITLRMSTGRGPGGGVAATGVPAPSAGSAPARICSARKIEDDREEGARGRDDPEGGGAALSHSSSSPP